MKGLDALAATIFGGIGSGVGPVHFDGDNSTFDVFVDSAAHPLSASLNLGTSAQPSDFGAINATSTYTFTNWGAEI